MQKLPIDPYLPQILSSQAQNLIITATPGSGKTTRIPPSLAEQSPLPLLCIEPRRLACIAAASRIASERGELVGSFSGYHVRMDKKCSDQTKLRFVTPGMLLQYLCADPFLEHFGGIIFDEFHERQIDGDIAFAMASYLQKEARPDLRIFVMSATLDAQEIAAFLDDCEEISVDAPLFPLEIRYAKTNIGTRFSDYSNALMNACDTALRDTDGDVLVFLPGVGDIRAAIKLAEERFGHVCDLLECHASMQLEEQRRVLTPKSTGRRLIFSTNVAESSLTIPGVHAVIDTGLAKYKFFDSVSGLSRLETQHISKASAAQRAGRAARLGNGLCLRLWNEQMQAQLDDQSTPEIERLDLSQSYLQITAWNLEAPENLPMLNQPARGRFDDALSLLTKLGAVENRNLTAMGHKMVHLPVEPRLARWLMAATEYGCLRDAALLAAYLSEAPYRRSMRDRFSGADLFEDFKFLKKNLQNADFLSIRRTANDILENAREISGNANDSKALSLDELREKLGSSMLLAYPDRLAKPRPNKEKFSQSDPRRLAQPILAVMSGNRGVEIREAGTLRDAKFFICADLDLVRGKERASNAVIKALEIDPKWIPWCEGVVARYETDKDRVVVAQAVHYDIFTLRETFLHDKAYDKLYEKTLLEAALNAPGKAVNLETDAWKQLESRLKFLQETDSMLKIPTFDDNWICEILPALVHGARSFEEMRSIDMAQTAKSYLPPEVQDALRKLAPERVKLENGFETAVDYTMSPPVIRVKIQKAFGIHRLPFVGGGKVMVMIHLCAPNGRAAQVTQDIENFWQSTYADVRKQLRGRYPKHDWPEIPC